MPDASASACRMPGVRKLLLACEQELAALPEASTSSLWRGSDWELLGFLRDDKMSAWK
jgi:hypothetical protein